MGAVLRGRVRPNLVSWFFWGLTALIAFVVQLCQHVGPQAFITLVLGAGPLAIFTVAVIKRKFDNHFNRTDWWCAALTVLGIVLWLTTRQPLLAMVMSIAADFISGIPTIIKSYTRPHTEHALPYCLSMASMAVTLLTIHHWEVAAWLFPAYILCTNASFVASILCSPKNRAIRGALRRMASAASRPSV